MGIYIFKFMII